MKRNNDRDRSRPITRRGAAIVEFALVASVIFMAFLGACEFCRLSMMRHSLDNAVYEAARRSIVSGATASEITAKAKSIMATLGISKVNVTVEPSVITDSTEFVTVTVSVPLNSSTDPSAPTLTRSLKMRRERSL
ncbi:MAG: TadE/TadG family type IV pilus assembly protein [Pirellula sp.]